MLFRSELKVPIYGTAFTLAVLERRLSEHDLPEDARLHAVRPRDTIEIGPFRVQFIHVTHSTVASVMLAITTPIGVLIHTGDFKVDPTPTDNELFDLHTVAEYGKQGVLALFSDSTNVERPGYTLSERAVRSRFDQPVFWYCGWCRRSRGRNSSWPRWRTLRWEAARRW